MALALSCVATQPVGVPRQACAHRDDHGVAHDGWAGASPEGWLPDRVSVGALTRAFPPGLVDRGVATDARERRRRLLPARQRRRTGCRAGYRLSESPPVLTGTNLD